MRTFHHFYIPKDKGKEKELQNFLELSIDPEKSNLFESLKRLNMNKDSITIRSTVSCPKETSHYNGHHLIWPETPIGEGTLPDEICITEDDSSPDRKCLADFYTGAHWSPVETNCTGVQSELTMTLFELAKINITEENILNLTQSMEMLTTTSEHLSPMDVQYVAKILRKIANTPVIESDVLKSVVHTVDSVIDTISTAENKDTLSNVPSKITSALEDIAMKTQTNNQAVKVAGNNIAVSVLPLKFIPRGGVLENWGSNITLLLKDGENDPEKWLNQFENFEAALFLPKNVLPKNGRNERTNMALFVRRNSQFLKNATVISPVIDVVMGTG
ncbi:unnamed protein product, partial [Larinioides sclopetarius]